MEEMVEEQKLEERAQAVKRLRSLFDMHKVVYGAPVNLRGMLLNLHHDRHLSMEFWAVVNSFSEGGGTGSLSEEEMFEAVVESVTGVTSSAMPAYEHPAVVELSQMIGGVDVLRPAAEALTPVEPLPEDLPSQQEMVAKHPASADRAPSMVDEVDPEEQGRRRTIGEALARLEQTTRELREQLAQIDSQPPADPEEVGFAETPLVETAMPLEQRAETQVAVNAPEPVHALVSAAASDSEGPADEQDEDLAGSPLAEALPRHRFIDVVPSEPRPVASMRTEETRWPEPERVSQAPEAASQIRPKPVVVTQPVGVRRVAATESDPIDYGSLSSPMEQIRPPAGATPSAARSAMEPTPAPAVTAPVMTSVAHAEAEVFDPKPAHRLSQRGLAVPPALTEDEINANPPSFGRYGEEPEAASSRGGMVAVVLILLLGAGAYAGSRTEQGRDILANARQWIETTYNSVTGHNETSEAPVSKPAPAPQPASPVPDTTVPQASTTPQTTGTPQPAASTTHAPPSPVVSAPAPAAAASASSSANESETPRAPRRPPFVDDSVLRVSSSAMATTLVASRAPVYPPAAISQQVEGVVTLDVVVGSNGAVRFAKAIDGDRLLRAAAEEAVLRWSYKPYILNGEPVSVSTTVQVRFKLPEE